MHFLSLTVIFHDYFVLPNWLFDFLQHIFVGNDLNLYEIQRNSQTVTPDLSISAPQRHTSGVEFTSIGTQLRPPVT